MEDVMKVLAIVQARMGSSRFPGKVLERIEDKTLINILLSRLSKAKKINEIILATTSKREELELINEAETFGIKVFKGSEDNVLERFYAAAKDFKATLIVRITGDCPLVDPGLVDEAIQIAKDKNYDYVSNVSPATFPDGLDVEVFKIDALKEAFDNAKDPFDLEHVTPYIRNNSMNAFNIENDQDLSLLRWTVDEKEDLEVLKNIFEYFSPHIDFSWNKVLNLYEKEPDLFKFNKSIKRNEGAYMGSGQKLWKRAKTLIPGGNMLLSKRSEMFLPDTWPSYFSKAKGCHVWDLDGNKYVDISIMGIGTNSLGYGNEEVDNAVRETISLGNMSTLNCPEEVYLSEKLIEINPWADMVRYARSGGEANAIAIRIARAASGKDNVAICGYHGWHDWYLSANISTKEGLKDHLLPGLEANGVPKNLEGTVFPFHYNNYEELEDIVLNNDIGTIKMEVTRSEGPKDDFLEKVRKLADNTGAILIFDECTSGFRETFGGMHKKFNVEPDMAMFGKALGNGYAITATLGKKEIMEAAQSTFISSTFWTERIGPTAALKTLEVMEKIRSWEKITKTGKRIKNSWKEIADNNELKIDIGGIDPLPTFTFKDDNNQIFKTYITQEMLKKGYLAANSVYVCTEHDDLTIEKYLFELNKVFKKIKSYQDSGDFQNMLEGKKCHSGFSRLN